MFGYPHSKVEVIVPFVGGAYGSKSYFKIEPLAVAIARKTGGRPVRWRSECRGIDADDASSLGAACVSRPASSATELCLPGKPKC